MSTSNSANVQWTSDNVGPLCVFFEVITSLSRSKVLASWLINLLGPFTINLNDTYIASVIAALRLTLGVNWSLHGGDCKAEVLLCFLSLQSRLPDILHEEESSERLSGTGDDDEALRCPHLVTDAVINCAI